MAWTLDNTAEGTYNNTNPDTVDITIAVTAKLLVVTRFTNGTTAPTGGAPTANGTPMTDSGGGFAFYSSGECGVQVWYLINPPTGVVTVSVPNDNTTFGEVACSSYIPSTGGAAFVNSGSASGLTQNPSTTYSVGYDNCLLYGALGSGDRDVPTAGTNYTIMATYDAGNQTWGTERWLDSGTAGTKTVSFGTARADDWGLIGLAFRETAPSYNLTVANTAHALTSEAVALAQHHILSNNNTAHILYSEGTFAEPYFLLESNYTQHLQNSDNTELTAHMPIYQLVMGDSTQLHTADNTALTYHPEGITLTTQDSGHLQNADNIILIQFYILVTNSTDQLLLSDMIGLGTGGVVRQIMHYKRLRSG